MDHLDQPHGKSATDNLHYWSRIEGKSHTMSIELLDSNTTTDGDPSRRRRATFFLGLALYLALAAALATLCLQYCGLGSADDNDLLKQDFSEPKYLTLLRR